MSGDLTARDVIAQGLDATDLGREGNRVPDYHPDDQDLMRDYTRWSDFTDRAEKLRQQRHKRAADAVLAALAAAGWELHRTGEVVPTSDVLNLADRIELRTDVDTWLKFSRQDVAAELRALTQQEPR